MRMTIIPEPSEGTSFPIHLHHTTLRGMVKTTAQHRLHINIVRAERIHIMTIGRFVMSTTIHRAELLGREIIPRPTPHGLYQTHIPTPKLQLQTPIIPHPYPLTHQSTNSTI